MDTLKPKMLEFMVDFFSRIFDITVASRKINQEANGFKVLHLKTIGAKNRRNDPGMHRYPLVKRGDRFRFSLAPEVYGGRPGRRRRCGNRFFLTGQVFCFFIVISFIAHQTSFLQLFEINTKLTAIKLQMSPTEKLFVCLPVPGRILCSIRAGQFGQSDRS